MRKLVYLGLAFVLLAGATTWAQCQHSVALIDSYGDGWNGGALTISVNGTPVLTGLTLASGYGPEYYYFNANTGDTIFADYTAGSWSSENQYIVYDGASGILCNQGSGAVTPGDCTAVGNCPTGPTPTPTETPTPPPGDTCADPIVLALNSCVEGTTVGATNFHDCGSGHAGPDIVYEFTLAAESLVTLIGEADFDADWTLATSCDALIGDLGCWDRFGTQADPSCGTITHDVWGYVNYSATLAAGTYYVWIDGYSASYQGNYALELIASSPCVVTCPGGGIPETEACGLDLNGGCNLATPAFEPIAVGNTVCGTLWADASARDTDWFMVVATEWTEYTFEGTAEMPFILGYVQYLACYEGSGNCADLAGTLAPYTTGNPCDVTSITVNVGPGIHYFFASPSVYTGFACSTNNDYYVTLTSVPGTAPTSYCAVAALTEDEYISDVTFGTIANTTLWDGYGDYTAVSTDIEIGQTYTLTITLGTSYTTDTGAAWIDWNQDMDFCDLDEAIVVAGSPGVGPYTADVTIPAHALLGATRMRIGMNYSAVPVMCGTSNYGDYEDYSVNILAASATATPEPTVTPEPPTATPTTEPPTATPTGPTPTPVVEVIPTTGPAGIGLLLLAIGALMSFAGIRRK